jgi:hypothetical protein
MMFTTQQEYTAKWGTFFDSDVNHPSEGLSAAKRAQNNFCVAYAGVLEGIPKTSPNLRLILCKKNWIITKPIEKYHRHKSTSFLSISSAKKTISVMVSSVQALKPGEAFRRKGKLDSGNERRNHILHYLG